MDRNNRLLGMVELVWLFGPKLEDGVQVGRPQWTRMYPEVALQVESAFSSCNTRLYCQVGDYLYVFCSMEQTNMNFGTKRPIRRELHYH